MARKLSYGHRLRVSWLGLAAIATGACSAVAVEASTPSVFGATVAARNQASTSAALALSACCGFGTYSYNMFNPDSLGLAKNWVLMPLATEDYPSLTKFTPVLARGWSLRGQQLTVELRSGVHWQDGSPVTSRDVYDTALLDGTNGSSFWNDITGVTAPSATEVVFTIRKGIAPVLAEDNLFADLYTVPASVYGSFVTPGLESAEQTYYAKDDTNPTAAAATTQYKTISSVYTKLAALPVPTLMGDGPFELKNVTTSEALLEKWNGFYDASAVHVGSVDYYDESNQAVYPLLLSGVLQFTSVELPPAILSRWRSTAGAHIVTHPTSGLVLELNDAQYPLDQAKVRQALAYLIPRSTMAQDAYGNEPGAAGIAEPTPDGLPSDLQSEYLTAAQIGQLNRYPVDEAKAASLLEAAGFHRSGGQWQTGHGKPFTLTLYSESGASDADTALAAAAQALDAFGIKASVEDVAPATLTADLLDGNFSAAFTLPGGIDPLQIFSEMLGSSNNFPTLGSAAGDKGMGFGPTVAVPGLGRVNVTQAIAEETATVAPGPTMDRLVWDWARLVNDQVPYLWYATKVYQLSYSTRQFGDWPATSSGLWDIMSVNRDAGLVLAMEQGYIRPKG